MKQGVVACRQIHSAKLVRCPTIASACQKQSIVIEVIRQRFGSPTLIDSDEGFHGSCAQVNRLNFTRRIRVIDPRITGAVIREGKCIRPVVLVAIPLDARIRDHIGLDVIGQQGARTISHNEVVSARHRVSVITREVVTINQVLIEFVQTEHQLRIADGTIGIVVVAIERRVAALRRIIIVPPVFMAHGVNEFRRTSEISWTKAPSHVATNLICNGASIVAQPSAECRRVARSVALHRSVCCSRRQFWRCGVFNGKDARRGSDIAAIVCGVECHLHCTASRTRCAKASKVVAPRYVSTGICRGSCTSVGLYP